MLLHLAGVPYIRLHAAAMGVRVDHTHSEIRLYVGTSTEHYISLLNSLAPTIKKLKTQKKKKKKKLMKPPMKNNDCGLQ